MSNIKSITRLLSVLFLGLVFTAVTGCGDSNWGKSSTSNAGTGTVALLLTDAPSDIFEEINITVVKAELVSDDGRVTVFEGERTFNLLELTDAEIFAISENIPAGSYSNIRLTLTDIELVDYMGTDDPADDAVYHPNLPGNGKLDLKPNEDFNVVADGTLAIQLDMDAKKSIHIVQRGHKDEYNFRPVVFIDIIDDAFEERFVKLHGEIDAIDTDDQSFNLCNTNIPVIINNDSLNDDSRGCVRVETDDTTSVFDANGQPAGLGDLQEGGDATVFGRLLRDTHHDDVDDEREMDDLVLKASLIELGPETGFDKLNGTATSAVDSNDRFDMDVEPGQGLVTPLLLTVQIQDGTQLINLKGSPVNSSDIAIGKLVNVRGVLDVDNNTLFASLIVVDTDGSTQLVGTVGANPDNSCGFTLNTSSGDRSVSTDSNTKAFLVTEASSSPIAVGELSQSQQADVYGNYGNSCFDAHTIIAYEPIQP